MAPTRCSTSSLFWFYSHPAVYIMILPAMGIVSEVIPVFSRKPIFGYRAMAFSMAAIGVLGFTVWMHHMFATGLSVPLTIWTMLATMMIAVPSGVKMFNWLGTMWGGSIEFTTPMLFAIGFLFMFLIGGVDGVFNAVVPVDYVLNDTYWVVSHIHYVLFGGSVFGVFAGIYYWFPKMTGRYLNETLGKIQFWVQLVGMNLAFMPMHILGLKGMPRRIADLAGEPHRLGHLEPGRHDRRVHDRAGDPDLRDQFRHQRPRRASGAGDDPGKATRSSG